MDKVAGAVGAIFILAYLFYEFKHNNLAKRLRCICLGHEFPKINAMHGEEIKYYGEDIIVKDTCRRCGEHHRFVFKLETFMREKMIIGRRLTR